MKEEQEHKQQHSNMKRRRSRRDRNKLEGGREGEIETNEVVSSQLLFARPKAD
jgi:hypothetical protein